MYYYRKRLPEENLDEFYPEGISAIMKEKINLGV
jgi:hypothetical protein